MSKKKTVTYEWELGNEELELQVASYVYGNNLYIGMVNPGDGESFADLTVNLPYEAIGVNEAYIEDMGAKDKLAMIQKYKLGTLLPEKGHSGYCRYNKVAFDLDRLAEFDPKGVQKYRELHGIHTPEQEGQEAKNGEGRKGTRTGKKQNRQER